MKRKKNEERIIPEIIMKSKKTTIRKKYGIAKVNYYIDWARSG